MIVDAYGCGIPRCILYCCGITRYTMITIMIYKISNIQQRTYPRKMVLRHSAGEYWMTIICCLYFLEILLLTTLVGHFNLLSSPTFAV